MAGLRAFQRIAELWQLSDSEQRALLGEPPQLERISYILGIYKALQILFPDPARADAWIRKPNQAFGGRTALDLMLAGNLVVVRRYLDGLALDERLDRFDPDAHGGEIMAYEPIGRESLIEVIKTGRTI